MQIIKARGRIARGCRLHSGLRRSRVLRQPNEGAQNGTMTITTQAVNYRDGDAALTGVFVYDDARTQRCPGILVVHGGAGLDNHARDRARSFSELGFVVFACDLYGDAVRGDRERVMRTIANLRADMGTLRKRAAAGLEVLRSHPLVDERIAAVGYCFGGMTVLELARGGANIAAVVSVHGSLKTPEPLRARTLKAKILVCHGALDPHVPTSDVDTFIGEMNNAGADFQLIVYGGAKHGFTDAGSAAMPGCAYHERSDARSTHAIRSFFAEVFSTDVADQ
jgi:dienelactone hydrolase